MRAMLALVLTLLPLPVLADDLALPAGSAADAPTVSNDIIRLARAGSRALALRRLTDIDLNGDGAIDAAELAAAGDAASDLMRGRLQVYFAQADADGDGAVSVPEFEAYGQVVALQAVLRAPKAADEA